MTPLGAESSFRSRPVSREISSALTLVRFSLLFFVQEPEAVSLAAPLSAERFYSVQT